MFSKNNRISGRQMFRLLTYDILGIGTLLLPSALAGNSEKGGMLSVLLGILAGVCYSVLIGWLVGCMREGESYPSFLKRCFGSFAGKAAVLFYALYYLCLGGYASYIFGHLIITELLKGQSFYWILAGILLLAIYGAAHGIEGRARVYEILFWFLLAPLFIMLILAAQDIQTGRLFPLYAGSAGELAAGSGFSFVMFSLGGMSLFLTPFAKNKREIGVSLTKAVLFSGIVMFALYALLQGMFGTKSMRTLEYPAVTLMSMVRIPGGFFQRQDALMVGIWFFTVFALIGSSLFYAAENLKELSNGKKENIWIAVAAIAFYGIAVASYRSSDVTERIRELFLFAATPLAVLIPFLAGLLLLFRGKGRKVLACVFICCMAGMFSGCSTQELENRQFPLAMGVDERDGGCQISYTFQDLSEVADQNAQAPGGTGFFIKDEDFFTGISQYANNTNKVMDYNHMKALVLSEEFVEDAHALGRFLSVCAKEELIARNTLLFFAENAAEILSLDENVDSSIGAYLEEMTESREDYTLKASVTLGDLLNDMANKEQLLLVPVLEEKGNLPVISGYYAVSYGDPVGEIEVSDAVLSYLVQGKIKKLAFSLEDGTPVSMNQIKSKSDFAGEEKPWRHNKLRLETVIEDSGIESGREKEIARQVEELFTHALEESAGRLLKDPGIDMTNSFYALGMAGRRQYERYRDDAEAYLKNLRTSFEVKVTIINEKK